MKTISAFIIATCLTLSLVSLNAAPVSVFNAQKTATDFYMQQKSDVPNPLVVSTKIFNSGNLDLIAVFTFNTGGFVAICLDNSFKPVLAYSLTGNHDPSEFSADTDRWFSDIANGLNVAINSGKFESILNEDWLLIERGEFPVLANKSGLLTTPEWGQGCYYNTMCPSDNIGPCGHCATGCTATAMAMIMKYWNYPQYGIGSHSYESQSYGTLSANFGETEYLWADMPSVVTEENPAVATLMYHCGVSVNMGYTGTTSGAAISPAAFFNYFRYSHNAVLDHQNNYTWPEWIALLENEIDNGRPVLYAGWESMLLMGHAFVCDGYDAMDYLHFNWGNDGSGNGYFLVPDEIAFPANNVIVRNIFPASDCDVKLSEITAPYNHTFTGPAAIKVIVENYSNGPLSDIPISYSVNDGDVVTETITETIEVNETYIYEFNTEFDFSQNPGMLYHIKVYSDLDCDTYRANDTAFIDILNVSCAGIPYYTDFEPGENTDGWLFEDVNDDGNTWNLSTSGETSIYYQGGINAADDWVFSRCLELEANKLYKLSFDYKSTGLYWPQNIGVSIGSAPESSLMITSLDEITGFVNDAYEEKIIYFTVNATDSYYLGFKCFSDPEMLNTIIDNVSITEMSEPDVALSEIIAPQTSCELGSEEIVFELRNLCSNIIDDVLVSYVLDGGEPVNEVFHPQLLPGLSSELIFEIPVDLSSSGSHSIKVFTSLLDDINHDNDTIDIIVENRAASYAPYLCEFETAGEYEYYVIENLNNDNRTWQFITSGGHTNPGCARYDYNDFSPADDWLITKCVYLENNFAYKLSFWSKIEDSQWPENLKVAIADAQNSSSMFPVLADYFGMTNTSWQQNNIDFTVAFDGYYYFGFYCYSAAQMFNLYIDDIEIIEDGLNGISSNMLGDFSIYPNPANDVVYLNNDRYFAANYTVEIFDLQGKKMLETAISGSISAMDISLLKRGIYFISITDGSLVGNYKFVKL
jgi:hypothetical protein